MTQGDHVGETRSAYQPGDAVWVFVHGGWQPAVVIDPGRAFGTGAHGSTRAALELLQTLEPAAALDLGCGSGVLSIAALLLGFGPLQAFDIDPLAVDATRRNAERNGVEVDVAGRIDSFKGGIRGSFPVIPDAPVTKFVLRMKAGRRGVLVNAENLCGHTQTATAKFIGHANHGWRLHPALTAACKKKKKKRGKRG